MRVLSVVGARPQFVKLGPIASALSSRAEHIIVHTGQHYDDAMSDAFFRDLGIPSPDFNLAVGSGSHGAQTAMMLARLEPVLSDARPDWVLVYGDTNSTLAAALAAVKLHLPLAHLEAGLRSFNRRMPEEHNRVLTDHAADLLLAPTEAAMQHLEREGLAGRAQLVGDVMTDVLLAQRDRVLAERIVGVDQYASGSYYLATLHRPDNTDDPQRLAAILSALAACDRPVVLLAHPRLRALAKQYQIPLTQGHLVEHDPLPYPRLIAAVMGSAGVVTDSGGLQKEAFLLHKTTTTVRAETEWAETVELGLNVLCDDPARLLATMQRDTSVTVSAAPYGDGRASHRVVDALLGSHGALPRSGQPHSPD